MSPERRGVRPLGLGIANRYNLLVFWGDLLVWFSLWALGERARLQSTLTSSPRMTGEGVDSYFGRAHQLAKEGIALGSLTAMAVLARYHQLNACLEAEQDYLDRAFELASCSAAGGNAWGQCALGVYYRDGRGDRLDPDRGRAYIQQGMDMGVHVPSSFIGDSVRFWFYANWMSRFSFNAGPSWCPTPFVFKRVCRCLLR